MQCDSDYSSKEGACYFLSEKYKPGCIPSNKRISIDRYANEPWRVIGNSVEVQGSSAKLFHEGYEKTQSWLRFSMSEQGGYILNYVTAGTNLACGMKPDDKDQVGSEAIIDINNQPIRFILRKGCESIRDQSRGYTLSNVNTYQVRTAAGFEFIVNSLNEGPLKIGTEYDENHKFKNRLEEAFAKTNMVHISNYRWSEKIKEMMENYEKKKERVSKAL
ncbi:hypothetical protein [Vibrio sp. 10N.261.51.A4]|uniref:hypothetical protein n=1 Tax=Vibrio sp. 10N.261.51.A4 TaxID=3229674 RepID=UPI003552ABAF